MVSQLLQDVPGQLPNRLHSCWPIWSGGEPTIILCVRTKHCEWPSCSRVSEEETVWRNAIGTGLLLWQRGKRTGSGRQGKCSRARCQRFALERHISLMGRSIMSRARWRRCLQKHVDGASLGKRWSVWTASSPKTGPKGVCKGPTDLSTMFNGCTGVCCSSGMTAAYTLKKSRLAMALAIRLRNRLPQPLARLFAPIPNSICHHLSCLAAQCYPNPGVVGFFEHKRPQFVQFQGRGSGILWVRGDQGGTSRRKPSYFFLIQPATVVRETPNVRVRPRRLLRSWEACSISSRRASG